VILLLDCFWYACSGHAISTNALIAAMRAHDGRGPPTRLTDAILSRLGLSSPDDIIR
jgi:N-acetylglucosamine kinase-like BadF-type ATPase